MNLNIQIIAEKSKNKRDGSAAKGEIRIDDHRESIWVPLDWWSLDDYKCQWQEGLSRLANHDCSCLVVSINDPNIRRYIEWWLLYKVNDKVYIRNSIVVSDIYKERIGDKPFTIENCYDFIPPRGPRFNAYGNEISEWVVDLNDKQ